MKISLSVFILLFPVFAVSYFYRLGESSFYLFDIFFIFICLFSIKNIYYKDFLRILTVSFGFVLVCSFGMINNIINYNVNYELDSFFAGVYRYFQFIYTLGFFVFFKGRIRKYNNMIHIFLLSISFPLLYSFVFYFLRPEQVIVFNRLASYFGNPNYLGEYICLSIFPIVYTISLLKGKVYFIFYILYFIFLLIFNLTFAGSNSYWLLSFFVLMMALVSLSESLLHSMRIILPIFVLGVIGYLVFGKMQNDEDFSGLSRTLALFETLIEGGSVSSLGSGELRSSLVDDAIAFILSSISNIIFGIGIGQSPIIIGAMHGSYLTAHNAHIVLFMEMGGIGYLYFIGVLFYFISKINLTKISLGFLFSYFVTILATPHVYMPFLWGVMVYGLFVYKISLIKSCSNK